MISKDAKALIELGTSPHQTLVLVSSNSDTLKVFKPSRLPGQQVVRPGAADFSVVCKLSDGRHRKTEFYYGSGYLSQSSRLLKLPGSAFPSLVLTDYQGQQKQLSGQQLPAKSVLTTARKSNAAKESPQ